MKRFTASCLAATAILVLVGIAGAGDWAHWRGPLQTGVSPERDLPEKFSTDPKKPDNNLIWQTNVGGRSTPIVMGDHVYLINSVGEKENEQERVVCFDAKTGKIVWEHKFNVFFTDIASVRVGWTNLVGDVETGNIYAHGTQGLLLCLSKDGKLLWQRSLTEEYGRVSGYGGRLTSPIVDSGLVIIGMVNASWGQFATGGMRYMAFDKNTGEVVWETRSLGQVRGTHASTPVVAVINGQRLVISGGADGAVHALKVRTGEVAWTYTFAGLATIIAPVVQGNYVFMAHGDENPDNNLLGRVICLDASKIEKPAKPGAYPSPTLAWQRNGMRIKFASPIIDGDRLYVADETANLFCLDAKTGKDIWEYRYGSDAKGSPVLADGKIYVSEVNAHFFILKPGMKECEELHKQTFRHPDKVSSVEVNGSPAVVDGRIYFCNSFATYCIGKKDHKAEPSKLPELPREAAPDKDAKITHLQLLPAEVELSPGQSITFKARGFDSDGRFVKEMKVKDWSLEAAVRPEGLPPAPAPKPGDPPPPMAPLLKGELAEGKFTADAKIPAQMGRVVAKADDLTAHCRVRVVPKLPYAPDFSKVPLARTPAGWINTQGKFEVKAVGGRNVLAKRTDNANPLVARAYAFMGRPTMSDYTIEADVQGTAVGGDLPDLGIVANRYNLMLMGATQSLRIGSWENKPRVDKTIGFTWKPGLWYHMKLTTEITGTKALVRGKIWEREKDEPKEWTIEYTDETPNTEGSPALYGNATGILPGKTGCEIYYDNVKVTPNKK
jgi:outer membrane protein assembly factor BamB